jgi:hypothetical protein
MLLVTDAFLDPGGPALATRSYSTLPNCLKKAIIDDLNPLDQVIEERAFSNADL